MVSVTSAPSCIMRFAFILFLTMAAAQERATTCREHPAYQRGWKPPLLRSWKNFATPVLFEKMLYAPRHSSQYHPAFNRKSTKYHRTDLLFIGGSHAKDKLARLYLNRPARVYLFIGVKRLGRRASLKGWKSEGYAKLNDRRETDVRYGVFQRGTILLSETVYVFSKQVESSFVDIPSEAAIWRAIKLPNNIRTHIRLAESDGKPSPPVGKFRGETIKPNTKCPVELHRMWVAKHKDQRDPQVRGRSFGSWHPVWDPCFWCSYGHDHGSNPKTLMGYEPTFAYTAMKNSLEDESHPGFKGFVFKVGKLRVYFNIHAQTSRLRRVTEQWHTTNMAIVNEKGKLMAEFSQKADFGFLSARGLKGVGFVPLRPIDRRIRRRQNLNFGEKRLRSVNVIDKNNLDRRFRYQLAKRNLLRGVYEAWITGVMCSQIKRQGELIIDFINPISGIKSVKQLGSMIKLGRGAQNVGLFRSIEMDINVGSANCKFKNGKVKGGFFYTDPRGEKLVKGPGHNSVRQYIHPGFRARLHGKFEVGELGQGMFVEGQRGFWPDHGFGIDVARN